MKSIFTKLSTLLLCGAVALVGCSDFSADLREVNERLEDLEATAATKAEVAVLKAEVEELKKLLNNQYATKEDVAKVEATVEAVKKDLKDAQDAFTAALDNKADKTALEKAVNDIQTALETAKGEFKTALEGLASENETLKGNLQALVEKVEKLQGDVTAKLETVDGNIAELQDDLQDLTYDVEDLQEELDAYKETVDKELKEIKEGFEKRGEELDEKFCDIDEQFTSIGDQLTAINGSLADLANADTDLEAKDKEIEEALSELEKSFDEFVKTAHQDLLDTVNDIIKETTDNYRELSGRIDALEDALLDLEDKVEDMETELRSIVSIPQMMLNGMNAVEFKSLIFVPMSEDSDEVVSAIGTNEYEMIPAPAYAYYRFNPSGFDVDNAEYSVVGETVEFMTKAATEDAVATVTGVAVENGKVKVEMLRGMGKGNVFALAATLENGNVIYSDYVQIIENQITAEDLQIVNNNNEAIYATLADVQANVASIQMNVGESHDISAHIEVIGAELSTYGLSLDYTLVEGKADLAEGVITADEAAAGSDNIIKIELVDADDCVVRRAYIKVRVLGNYIYYKSTATAQVPAERVAFEVSDILAWAQALKDEPNTKELIQQAYEAIKAKDYLKAYQLLGGVPGFVKKNTTFTGVAVANIRVEDTLTGTLNSLVPEINLIDSVEDLTVAVKKMEQKFEDSAFSNLNSELISKYIPSINEIPLLGSLIDRILTFKFSDILESDFVTGVLKLVEKYIDFEAIRGWIIPVVENLEKNMNADTQATAEAIAKATSIATAETESITTLIANIEKENEQVIIDINNGNWGKLLKLIDNQIAAQIFEKLQIGDVYNSLLMLAESAQSIAQWSYNPLEIKVIGVETERVEVVE